MTFELAIKQLGGDAVVSTGPIGEREPVKDVARNLDRWTNGIVARVFSQSTIDELAAWSSVPVINALSDRFHPCQALADVLTLKEHFGRLDGLKLAFVGDGNNVAHSLMLTAATAGSARRGGHAAGYEPDAGIAEEAARLGQITLTNDPAEAVADAHAVYTDVWASMGQESEAGEPRARVCAVPGERSAARPGSAGCRLHALPAGEARPRSDRRRDGIAALGGVRSGREPAARAEGVAADAAGLNF